MYYQKSIYIDLPNFSAILRITVIILTITIHYLLQTGQFG